MIKETSLKQRLIELSIAIKDSQQALDNAVSEMEYLERQVKQLSYQIKHAYKLPDGSYLDLETLALEYTKLKTALDGLGNSYVG